MRSFLAGLTLAIALTLTTGLGVAQGAGKHDHSGHSDLPGAEGGFSPHSVYQLETPWVNEVGDDYSLSDLSHHPVVTAMIYTSCEYACPLIIGKMLAIYDGLDENMRKNTRFVLFSFDPERDTPDKLNPYKKSQSIDKPEWMVLTSGDDDAPLELAVALGVRYKKTPDGEFAHSNIITVLDGQGVPVYQMVGLDKPVSEALDAVTHSTH